MILVSPMVVTIVLYMNNVQLNGNVQKRCRYLMYQTIAIEPRLQIKAVRSMMNNIEQH